MADNNARLQGWIRTSLIAAGSIAAVVIWAYTLNAAQGSRIEDNAKVIERHQVQLEYVTKTLDEIKLDMKDTRRAVEEINRRNGTLGQLLDYLQKKAAELPP